MQYVTEKNIWNLPETTGTLRQLVGVLYMDMLPPVLIILRYHSCALHASIYNKNTQYTTKPDNHMDLVTTDNIFIATHWIVSGWLRLKRLLKRLYN